MELKLRAYSESDYLDQRVLFKLSFPEVLGTSAVSRAHYDWKFVDFPAQPSSYQYVASDSELVGYYAAIPYKYKIGDEQLTCGMVCDVMTHPDRRGKGIFTKLGRYATDQMKIEGLDFTSGYPIRPEVIPGHLKVGWQVILKMPMYVRPIGIRSFLPRGTRFLSYLINPLFSFVHMFTMFPNSKYRCDILSRKDFLNLDGYQDFLDRWLSQQENALVKSMNFLAWRTNAPDTNYQFLVLKDQSKIAGVCISRRTLLKGIQSLAIIDMMLLTEYLDGASVFHQNLKKLARLNRDDVIVCMTSAKWASAYRFGKNFYFRSPAVFSLIIKKLNNRVQDSYLFAPARWHLFWLDSDDL